MTVKKKTLGAVSGAGQTVADIAKKLKAAEAKKPKIDEKTWENMSPAERREVRDIRKISLTTKIEKLKRKLEDPNYEPAVKGETSDEKLKRQNRNANRKLKQLAKKDPAIQKRIDWARDNPNVPLEEMPTNRSVGSMELTKTQKKIFLAEAKRKKAAKKKRRKKIMSQMGLGPVGKSTRTKTLKYTARGGLMKSKHKDYRKGGLFKKGK